jgi:hypothetical protein
MASVNNINTQVDLSARTFNTFNSPTIDVNSNEYVVVNSFFKSVSRSTFDTDNLTATFFLISQATGIPVLTLLDQIEGTNELQITATMASYLNAVRSPSALIGINATVVPNFYAARNVLP